MAGVGSNGVGLSFTNTLIALQRLHSLAFGFGTFAYAKDQASLPHDGLLKENPPPLPINYTGLFYAEFISVTRANPTWVDIPKHAGGRPKRTIFDRAQT
jgi:hypothetical protein